MPLVAHTNLPTFARLQQEGTTVIPTDRVDSHEFRELHVGLLNMMPDAALEATERQFYRLVGRSNQVVHFYLHPFTLDSLPRGPAAAEHISRYYETFAGIREQGLDALIVTGANVGQADLTREPFWEPLIEVFDWAYDNVTSTLCSCLTTHAVLQFRYGQARRPLPGKRWGVFRHHVRRRDHPLVRHVNTSFDVPHSRFNAITREQFHAAGLHVLVESDKAGVHLATSEDQFRIVFFQGHPEYDTISLLKEYKREVMLYIQGQRKDFPPFPENYVKRREKALMLEYRERVDDALTRGGEPPPFPEDCFRARLENTWHDTAEAVVGNWIGGVYQVTNHRRDLQFMDGIDPNDPLGLGGPILKAAP
jgi:homoserine O-succinyltransferase